MMRANARGPFERLAKPALAAVLGSCLAITGHTVALAGDAAQASTSSSAAAAAPASVALQSLHEVVVTGSRIKQPTLTGSAALQVINSGELKAEGTQSIDAMLDTLPSVQGNFSLTQTSNPGGARGVANVDLRGLGPSRTLTLIDGKRVMPGSPLGGPEADLNFIPQALVER
ncbi:MAG: TonB-dependent receptor plug domain-containing protein, partial [Gammaproteobacteria bacterium]|nr:TonB-dependent receptor plug domain-containing protein [Gammaproteobacteria bacterium]